MLTPLLSFLCSSLLLAPQPFVRIGKAPAPPTPPTLQQLTQRAGYIFSGTVLTVERVQPKTPNEVATVRITFKVNQAVRGVATRQIFTIREWAGLWQSGARYRPGEQVMLFLYRPSKVGLTSPVNGELGRFNLDNHGKALLDAQRLANLQIAAPVVSTPPIKGRISISSRDLVRAIRKVGD
jgi:hypothetical protein